MCRPLYQTETRRFLSLVFARVKKKKTKRLNNTELPTRAAYIIWVLAENLSGLYEHRFRLCQREMTNIFYFSYVANCFANGFLCYTAVTLNILVIQVIRKTTSLSNKTLKTLLLSLAASDLGVGLVVQPLYIALLAMEMKHITENSLNYDNIYKAFLLTANMFGFASFFCVTALSADRFLSVHFNLRYRELVTHRRVVGVVISIWVISAFLSLIRIFISKEIMYLIFATIEFTCIISAAYFSFKIYVATRSHTGQIRAQQVQRSSQNGEIRISHVTSLQTSVVITIALYLLFLVCYLPQMSVLFVTAVFGQSEFLKMLLHHTTTLVFLNSSLNPMIYCWKMRRVRKAVLHSLRRTFSRQWQLRKVLLFYQIEWSVMRPWEKTQKSDLQTM